MPQETKSKQLPQTESPGSLEGLVASRDDERALLDALEKAFDYRGDVTLTLIPSSAIGVLGGGGPVISGYIFDRTKGESLKMSHVRIMVAPPDPRAGQKISVRFSQIAKVEFTGKDAAHGKTFENWVKRFVEKKLKGEKAGIEAEELH